MRITEILERSVSWDNRFVDFLGDCSIHCLTVTMCFSVLTDSSRLLRSLNLCTSHLAGLFQEAFHCESG